MKLFCWASHFSDLSLCLLYRGSGFGTARTRLRGASRVSGCNKINVWTSDPLFYPAKPRAHWLMVAEVAGQVLMVPLAPSNTGDPTRCRPIGCYIAANHLARRYREDR